MTLVALLGVEIVEVELGGPVRARGDHDDAVGDLGQQQVGEREVAEVVGAELQLEAVLGATERRVHHARVVDQDIDLAEVVCERADGREIGEVEPADLGLACNLACSPLALAGVAHGEHDTGAVRRERLGGGEPDPAAGAGDHDPAALEGREIGGGPLHVLHRSAVGRVN